MTLDLAPLEKALDSLGRGIARAQSAPADEELRDAVIQRFEFTYELCWKMLKRQIEQEVATPAEVDRLGYKDLMRVGAERGLIADPEVWFRYREQRNLTSHTYDEKTARQVYRTALGFADDARRLLNALRARNPAP